MADARVVPHAAERAMGVSRSVRPDAVVHRATALLGDPYEAEAHFRAATAPVTARRPSAPPAVRRGTAPARHRPGDL
ncbi:hypothetical protein ACF1G5_02055 [Streptomyces coeruleorubidus]|uniref:hypothetical protein n=1 Tax=Streptomyces coeruleorubidus TaxID=116188 RepID=UPI0036F83BF3